MNEEKKQCDSKSCTKEDCAGCSHAKGAGVPKENLNTHSKIKKVIGVVSGKGGVGKSLVTASLANCAGCSHAKGAGVPKENLNTHSKIKKVIGVVSGKGGVGKSLVTASLANEMAFQGYRVGIMDADITGPSIPRMYGLKGSAVADDKGIYPMETGNDVKVMSVNLLLPQEDAPVIWRGPILANMVKQFWTDVVWGELDYLFVDMPPGTGDVPLTVFQSLPIEGIVIVSSPQDLVQMIVKKAYNMAKMMNVPVFGLVENYSYVKCPDCGKEIYIFGESKVDAAAEEVNVPVIGKMPLDREIAAAVDAGQFAGVVNTYLSGAGKYLPEDAAAEEVNVPVIGKMPLDREIAAAVDAGQFAGVVNTYLSGAGKYLPEV